MNNASQERKKKKKSAELALWLCGRGLSRMAELVSKEDWQGLLDSVDTVLFDCDGE